MKKRKVIIKIMLVLLMVCSGQIFAASCGDVDSSGDIDIVDALLIAQYYVGLDPANFDSTGADVNVDGTIDIIDALLVAQLYVGLISELPCSAETPAPTPGPQTEPVWSGGPYTLNGTTDYVDLPDGLTNNLSDFSITCWVSLNSLDTWTRIFDFGGDSNVFMMLTPASGNTGFPYFCITISGNGGEQGIDGTNSLPTGSWQHLAVTRSGNTGILYINGQEAGRNTGITLHPSDLGNTTNNYIGRSQWEQDPYLSGSVDDFYIYDRAISSSEITSLANNPPPTPAPTETPAPTATPDSGVYVAYLLAYFRNENEKLHYAISTDPNARSFSALNGGNPIMQQFVRDPYINRLQNGNFAFVHTSGWADKTIAVWRSNNLINWTGGNVGVMSHTDTNKCWAPEYTWSYEENLYYVYWASNTSATNHNRMWYAKTSDFINFTTASLWFDIGTDDIDLSIVHYGNEYLGFHKVGGLDSYNRLSRTGSLNQGFTIGTPVFTDGALPTEGPETFQLIGQNKWYVIVDPFDYAMEVRETTNFSNYTRIQVTFPPGAKHCSVIPITQSELDALRAAYP